MLANTPPMLECHYGVPMTGAVLNTINTRLDAAVIAFDILFAEPDQTSPEQFLDRLPPEEADELKPYAVAHGLDTVLLTAPTTDPTPRMTRIVP